MTLSSRFALTLVLTAAGSLGAQQQWGPPAQSKLYHDPAHTPTYTSYNTASRTITAPAPIATSQPAAAPVAKPVVRHRTAVRHTTTTTNPQY